MSATNIAQFNAQQQAAFIHHPRNAHVCGSHNAQRYFNSGVLAVDLGPKHDPDFNAVGTCVLRFSDYNYAHLKMSVNTSAGDSSISALMTPTELRDLAARLIDAAHDIELWPSDRLADYASLCDAPQEVAA